MDGFQVCSHQIFLYRNAISCGLVCRFSSAGLTERFDERYSLISYENMSSLKQDEGLTNFVYMFAIVIYMAKYPHICFVNFIACQTVDHG